MNFDWTISIGHILTFAGFIFGGLGFVYAMRYEVRRVADGVEAMKERMKSVEKKMDNVSDAMVQIAVQKNELENMGKRIDDLQHGRGFVLDGLPRAIKSGRT